MKETQSQILCLMLDCPPHEGIHIPGIVVKALRKKAITFREAWILAFVHFYREAGCIATNQEVAEQVGCGKRQIINHLSKLIESGILIKETLQYEAVPHHYVCRRLFVNYEKLQNLISSK